MDHCRGAGRCLQGLWRRLLGLGRLLGPLKICPPLVISPQIWIRISLGKEIRNIILFYFPLIIKCIQPNEKERKLWLQFSYVIRACILPNNKFRVMNLNDIAETCQKFYELFSKLLGDRNCTYYTHVVCGHLIEMRYHGPLTFTSAFGFESFYGELRNSFTPGTQSTLKQCLEKVYLKRNLSYHCCQNSNLFQPERNTVREQFPDLPIQRLDS